MRRDVVLMVDHNGEIKAVNEQYETEKRALGWFLVGRDADVFSLDMGVNVQSNPVRPTHGYGATRDADPGDER